MDRRQQKTRQAIFLAFSRLLARQRYDRITVGQIIDEANVGRSTFYAHFETKDFLLKELCDELFCHVFDATESGDGSHKHIFECEAPSSVILHLLYHLQKNDNNILELLACENNDLFLRYFKESLKRLIQKQPQAFFNKKTAEIPDGYWVNYVSTTFVETVKWWLENGMKESPEVLAGYFAEVI